MDKNQQKTAIVSAFLLTAFGTIMHVLAQKFGPDIPTHFVSQAGNISLIGALVSYLAAFHAHLTRLALMEKKEEEIIEKKEQKLFDNEVDDYGRYQQSLHQFKRPILPCILLLISVFEIALALWVIHIENTHVHEVLPKNLSPMLVVASIMATFSILAFVTGKFCSGAAFGNNQLFLRPVSAMALLSAFVYCAGALASLMLYWDYPIYGTFATWLFCIIGLFLAGERIVTWVLELYRPQSQSIWEIPVYESRILGLFNQPQGILVNLAVIVDYQFGVKLSERWLYAWIRRAVLPIILVQLISLSLLTSIVYIQPHESGLSQNWWSSNLQTLAPGLHFQLPWPMTKVERIPNGRVQHLSINPVEFDRSNNEKQVLPELILWQNARFKPNLLMAGSRSSSRGTRAGKESQSATISLVSAGISIRYSINDNELFFSGNRDARALLSHLARRELTRYIMSNEFPSILQAELNLAEVKLQEGIQKASNLHQLGIEILYVGFDYLQSPPQVAPAFTEVISAQEERQSLVIEAQKFAIQVISEAEQESNSVIRKAEAETSLITNLAEVEKTNFMKQRKIYKKYPRLYKTRVTMNALEEWLTDVRKVVTTSEAPREVINLELRRTKADLLSIPID